MSQVNLPNLKVIDAKMLGKLLSDLKRGIEKWDLDDGWEVTLSPKLHRLKVTPRFVQIQVSDDIKGDAYSTVHADSVTNTEIAFTTAKAYMRVLAEK